MLRGTLLYSKVMWKVYCIIVKYFVWKFISMVKRCRDKEIIPLNFLGEKLHFSVCESQTETDPACCLFYIALNKTLESVLYILCSGASVCMCV